MLVCLANLILEYLTHGSAKVRFLEYLYFWMWKPYSINVQRSLVDLTDMLPKAKTKLQKGVKLASVSFARQSYCQSKILCVFRF